MNVIPFTELTGTGTLYCIQVKLSDAVGIRRIEDGTPSVYSYYAQEEAYMNSESKRVPIGVWIFGPLWGC